MKLRCSEAWNILEHHCARLCFLNESQSCREKISFIVSTKLFARDAEWRTWDTADDKVYSGEIFTSQTFEILLKNVPVGTIAAESGTKLRLDLHCRLMAKTSLLQAQSLATASCTKFDA